MRVETARREIEQAIAGHERFALQFSGGKDSLACLYLLKPWWDRLIVLWNNMGDPYPEAIEQMRWVSGLVKEFHEIKGNSRASNEHSYPVDLLPMRATIIGRALEPEGATITLKSRFDCCWANFWLPMTKAVSSLGITLLIRGQRDSEQERAPIDKDSRDPSGAEILLPLKGWKYDEVFDYLKAEGAPIPRTYEYIKTSVDCMMCTAWAEDARGKVAYLRKFHPNEAVEYERRMRLIAIEVLHGAEEMQRNLDEICTKQTTTTA